MKNSLIALTAALVLCAAPAMAAPAKKAPAKKAVATKKAVKKTTKKATAKPAVKATPAKVTVLPPQDLPTAIAGEAGEFPVIVGTLKCDEGQLVIKPEGSNFKLTLPNNREYTLRRVKTTTGVVRLEDEAGNSMWLQTGNKSMLIDRRGGGLMVDGCRNADQQARENELKLHPSGLLN